MGEADQGMSHQCHTAALGGGAEESNLDLPVFQVLGVMLDRSPCVGLDGLFEIVQVRQFDVECSVHLHQACKTDLQQWLILRAENSSRNLVSASLKVIYAIIPDAFAAHRLRLFVQGPRNPTVLAA